MTSTIRGTADVAHAALVSPALRSAGLWALIAAALTLLQPVVVFLVPWQQYDAGFADPTHKLDPVATMDYGWLGFVQGLHFLALAAALVFAAVRLGRALAPGSASAVAAAGAAVGATLTVVVGGIAVTAYTTGQWTGLAQVLPDPAIRKTIGFAEILIMQGIAGAAGIGIVLWIVASCWAMRAAGTLRRALPITATVLGALILLPWLLGYGAATSLLAFIPLAVFGFGLRVAGRRAS